MTKGLTSVGTLEGTVGGSQPRAARAEQPVSVCRLRASHSTKYATEGYQISPYNIWVCRSIQTGLTSFYPQALIRNNSQISFQDGS